MLMALPFSLPHLALFAGGLHGACANEQQVQEVAPVQRQLLHLFLADELRDRGAIGVQ